MTSYEQLTELAKDCDENGLTLYYISYPRTDHRVLHIKDEKSKLDVSLMGKDLQELVEQQRITLDTWLERRVDQESIDSDEEDDFL